MAVFIIIICLSGLVILLRLAFVLLCEKTEVRREKSSPYECGFDPVSRARSPFSLRFFLVAILFVVFDVEVAIIIPIIIGSFFIKRIAGVIRSVVFIVILFVGLYHEYREGSLEWVN